MCTTIALLISTLLGIGRGKKKRKWEKEKKKKEGGEKENLCPLGPVLSSARALLKGKKEKGSGKKKKKEGKKKGAHHRVELRAVFRLVC